MTMLERLRTWWKERGARRCARGLHKWEPLKTEPPVTTYEELVASPDFWHTILSIGGIPVVCARCHTRSVRVGD